MASKSDIAEFISKIDFDEKLISINKNVTLNKKKHVLVQDEIRNYKHLRQVSCISQS